MPHSPRWASCARPAPAYGQVGGSKCCSVPSMAGKCAGMSLGFQAHASAPLKPSPPLTLSCCSVGLLFSVMPLFTCWAAMASTRVGRRAAAAATGRLQQWRRRRQWLRLRHRGSGDPLHSESCHNVCCRHEAALGPLWRESLTWAAAGSGQRRWPAFQRVVGMPDQPSDWPGWPASALSEPMQAVQS